MSTGPAGEIRQYNTAVPIAIHAGHNISDMGRFQLNKQKMELTDFFFFFFFGFDISSCLKLTQFFIR